MTKAKDFDYQHMILVECHGPEQKGGCKKPPHQRYFEKRRPSLARSLAAARRHVARTGHEVWVVQYTQIFPSTREKLQKVADDLAEGR